MENEIRTITVNDGAVIYVHMWTAVAEPKAVIQVFHGMAEHAARYDTFARTMNDQGFIVYANDHRGHGKTAGSVDKLGYLGKDGFNRVMEDEVELTEMIKSWHPGLPVFILGHSFGSFIAQEYITGHSDAAQGFILTGSGKVDGANVKMGRIVSKLMAILFNETKQSPLLYKMNFSSFNKRINHPSSPNAWLNRDEAEVQKYDHDSYCGTVFTINFYKHFTSGLSKLYDRDKLAAIPKNLPIQILAGDMDPVGNYGKGPTKLYELYRSLGLDQVNLKLYPGARHEIMNEFNREEVFDDIAKWINRKV